LILINSKTGNPGRSTISNFDGGCGRVTSVLHVKWLPNLTIRPLFFRGGVGLTDAFECQRDLLKIPPHFAVSRDFAPIIFHFKECPEKSLPLFLAPSLCSSNRALIRIVTEVLPENHLLGAYQSGKKYLDKEIAD
jgi:hypothetical protein